MMAWFWISSLTQSLAGLPALVVGFCRCLSYDQRMVVSGMESLASGNVLMSTLELLKPIVSSPELSKYTATSIHFYDGSASIITCTLETHKVYVFYFVFKVIFSTIILCSECYSIEPWALKWSKQLRTRMCVYLS